MSFLIPQLSCMNDGCNSENSRLPCKKNQKAMDCRLCSLKKNTLDFIIQCSELKTLELDTFNPDRLIWISNVDTFNFLLNPLWFFLFFIPSADPDQCRSFLIKWCIQFRIFPDSDWLCRIFYSPLYWLNFTHFLGYKLKLILRLIKREYQTLISISTILKFSDQKSNIFMYLCKVWPPWDVPEKFN